LHKKQNFGPEFVDPVSSVTRQQIETPKQGMTTVLENVLYVIPHSAGAQFLINSKVFCVTSKFATHFCWPIQYVGKLLGNGNADGMAALLKKV